MGDRSVALLVARPGRLRDGWRALLLAAPQIGSVSVVEDLPAALAMAGSSMPQLVVLDGGLFNGGIGAALQQIQAGQPLSRCLVLAEDGPQGAAACAAGADAVLVKGFPASALYEVVDRLRA